MFGVIHFETMPLNQTITAQPYCDQLDRLNKMLKEKRSSLVNCKGVIFHHNNARSHSARITCNKIEELIWEKLQDAPYSPNIAPSDYHLFQSLQHFTDGREYSDVRHLKWICNIFSLVSILTFIRVT